MPNSTFDEWLSLSAILSNVFVGPCPRCGSTNTHQLDRLLKELGYEGELCPLCERFDDPTIGHCDDCGYLWCLLCGSELTLTESEDDVIICDHYSICEECGRWEYCPYMPNLNECPKISSWLNEGRK